MLEQLDLQFCEVSIYDQYLIVVMNTGIHVTPEYNEILEGIVVKYYRNKPFVYLTWRKNSYSVDPAIYKKTAAIPNLLGFGVIAQIPVSKANAQIEKQFMPKPFEIFDTLAEAEAWALNLIAQHG